ncbi:MAG: MFS transporter [Rhodoglobus sp.]
MVGFLAVSEVTSGLLQSWFAPLLMGIGAKLEVNPAQLNWVIAAYLLSTVVCVPLLAKFGDRFGHKRMVLFVLGIVMVGTIVTVIAPNFFVFILGRVIQGALGALLPLEIAIVRERAGAQAGRAIGLLVGCLGGGAAAGTLLSGFLGGMFDVSLVLGLPIVLLLISFVLIALFVPETAARSEGRIDWVGATLLGAGLGLSLYGVSNGNSWGWTQPMTLGCIGVGVVLIVAFFTLQTKIKSPLIDVSLITKGGVGFLLLLTFFFGMQFYGSGAVNALYLSADPTTVGYGFGLAPFGVALGITPGPLALMFGASVSDAISRKIGQSGTLYLAAALVVTWFIGLIVFRTELVPFVLMGFVGGFGTGMFVSLMPSMIVSRAPHNSSGIAGAFYNTARTLSGAVAGAIFAAVMSGMFLPDSTIPAEGAFVSVWSICIGVTALVVLALPFLKRFGGTAVDLP